MGFFSRLFRSKIEKMEEKRDVKGLIEILKDENENNKVDVVRALGRIGDRQAIDPLYDLIPSKTVTSKLGYRLTKSKVSAIVEVNAAIALVMIGDSRAIKTLFFSDYYFSKWSDDQTYQSVIQALDKIGEPAIDAIVEVFKGGFRSSRSKAVEVLDDVGWKPRNDVEKAWYMLAKRNWDEMEKLGEPAIEPLLDAIKHWDQKIHRPAMQALCRMGELAVEPLMRIIWEKDFKRAANELGTEAIELLIKKTTSEQRKAFTPRLVRILCTRNASLNLRNHMATVLDQWQWKPNTDNEHLQYLRTKSQHDEASKLWRKMQASEVRRKKKAEEREKRRKKKDSVKSLIIDLKTGSLRSRRLAARELGFSRDMKAVEPLIEALKDEELEDYDYELQYEADIQFDIPFSPLEALVNIGTPAVPALKQALKKSDSPRFRDKVKQVLRLIEKRGS